MRYSNAISGSPAKTPLPTYYGNYLGIVIQNNDPEKRGRVKVYVPHISPTIYETVKRDNKDKYYKFMGDNIQTDLTPKLVEDLKSILPWSEVVAPVSSGASSGKYINYNNTASISDSNRVETSIPSSPTTSKYSLNKDGTGEKYGKIYEINEGQQSDAFSKTINSNIGDRSTGNPNRVNPYTHLYKPKTYSNCGKGQFAIPDVGAHVWVFFREGNPQYPVIFGTMLGSSDWKSVYQGEDNFPVDYPGDYNNVGKADLQDYSPDVETYRGKMVLNQKGGVIEVVNTDNKEAIRFTGYSGSYTELNNDSSVEFNANNKQILTLADHFETINGYKNEFTQRDLDEIVRGDHFEKVGNFNKDAMQEWKNIDEEVASIKQLFEIKRTPLITSFDNLFDYTSSLQTRVGSFGRCPVCSADYRAPIWYRRNTFYFYRQVNSSARYTRSIPMAGNWTTSFNMINDSSFSEVRASGWRGRNITVFNYGKASTFTQPTVNSKNFLGSGPCPVCNGTGISPSSQNGNWEKEDKEDLLKLKLESKIAEITEIEKRLGLGGSKIIQVSKHQSETIGLVMNDLPNIRKDNVGKITNNSVNVAKEGVYISMKESPIYEYVHVEDLPGGTYNLNVCNRWNVLVGSGGVAIKSYGPVDIAGSITNLTGEQVNISSDSEINIQANKRLFLESDILTLRQTNGEQVLIDSNLGVSQNLVVAGSSHFEGEVTLQHITAPIEFQETEQVKLEGFVLPNTTYRGFISLPGCRCSSSFSMYFSHKVPVNVGNHSHQFRNVPLTLMAEADDVRQIGSSNTSPSERTTAFPPVNEKKNAITIRDNSAVKRT